MNLTEGRIKLLRALSVEPKSEKYLRELVKESKLSVGAVHKYLNEFEKEKIVRTEKKGKIRLIKIDLSNPLTTKMLELLEIRNMENFKQRDFNNWRIVDNLTTKLKERLRDNLLMLVLFGSVARGMVRRTSDIDILIVVKDKKRAERVVDSAISEIYSYGREIVPLVINLHEFRDGIKGAMEFYQTLKRDKLIFYGESLFWKIIREEES